MMRVPLLAVVLVVCSGFTCMAGQAVKSLYDIRVQYHDVEMIELMPGVVVRADIWPDDYVPTVEDFVSIGLSVEDAEAICYMRPNTERVLRGCTWGQIKLCFAGKCIPSCCPENCPDKKDG